MRNIDIRNLFLSALLASEVASVFPCRATLCRRLNYIKSVAKRNQIENFPEVAFVNRRKSRLRAAHFTSSESSRDYLHGYRFVESKCQELK